MIDWHPPAHGVGDTLRSPDTTTRDLLAKVAADVCRFWTWAMPVTIEESVDELAVARLGLVPGVTGHVVLVEGEDHAGDQAVAVWHASATGAPVGAWIKPVSLLASDPAAADELLRLTSHRALFGWDTETGRRLLETLAGWAGREPVAEPVTVRLPDVLAEIAQRRRTYEAAVEEHHRRSGSKLNPLVWRHDVPEVQSWPEFVRAARLHPPTATCPVAVRALHLVRAVAWAAEVWHDSETVRTRRNYLADRFGPATVLPPAWLGQLRQAQSVAERP